MTLFSWLPNGVALVLWGLGATAGLAFAASRIGSALGRPGPEIALRMVAVALLVLAFAVALLFGNLDALYPLAYGALVLAVLPGASAAPWSALGSPLGSSRWPSCTRRLSSCGSVRERSVIMVDSRRASSALPS